MFYNENLEVVNANSVSQFKQKILSDYMAMSESEKSTVDSEEAKNTLMEYYNTASEITNDHYFPKSHHANKLSFFGRLRLWRNFKKGICGMLQEGSTVEDLINAVLEVLSKIIPGGILIQFLAEKLVKYFLKRGYEKICG